MDKGNTEAADALLSEAFLRGRRAGLVGLSSSLTISQPGSPEYAEEMRGWYSGHNEYAQRALPRKDAA